MTLSRQMAKSQRCGNGTVSQNCTAHHHDHLGPTMWFFSNASSATAKPARTTRGIRGDLEFFFFNS